MMSDMTDKERQLVEWLSDMNEDDALDLAKKMLLEEGVSPLRVLELCRNAMDIVGKRFEEGEYFLPELVLAGEMLETIGAIAKPLITHAPGEEPKKLGKVLIGTVHGDLHDIGKNIVSFMLDINGFDVKDIGIDVPVKTFIEEIRAYEPDVVGLSGFLTLAFDSMKETIAAIEKEGMRQQFKVMIGGGQIDETVRAYTGADAFGINAVEAVNLCRSWTEKAA
jgi:5-methyltetrahydrofolate--homocysteine methyltransferase